MRQDSDCSAAGLGVCLKKRFDNITPLFRCQMSTLNVLRDDIGKCIDTFRQLPKILVTKLVTDCLAGKIPVPSVEDHSILDGDSFNQAVEFDVLTKALKPLVLHDWEHLSNGMKL